MKNDKVNEILEYLKNELKYNNCNIGTKEKGWEQYNGLDDDLLHYIRKIEKENKRLNNIINELEKFLKDKIDSWKRQNDDEIVKDTIYHERLAVRLIYDYLQELK